jgi:hypothetical protein
VNVGAFWRPFRGLSRVQCADFGVAGEAFWRPFRGLSRVHCADFGVSTEAFWRPFRGLSRVHCADFGVSGGAFWRPFRGLSRVQCADFGVAGEAFWRPFRGLSRVHCVDFEVGGEEAAGEEEAGGEEEEEEMDPAAQLALLAAYKASIHADADCQGTDLDAIVAHEMSGAEEPTTEAEAVAAGLSSKCAKCMIAQMEAEDGRRLAGFRRLESHEESNPCFHEAGESAGDADDDDATSSAAAFALLVAYLA